MPEWMSRQDNEAMRRAYDKPKKAPAGPVVGEVPAAERPGRRSMSIKDYEQMLVELEDFTAKWAARGATCAGLYDHATIVAETIGTMRGQEAEVKR